MAMANTSRKIFVRNKPLVNIYSGLDQEGKKVEVREDAEQHVKWHEISDALVAAGYYRAQLQSLSQFDRIVGGLSWCIELCDIDVDISLLFEENLTIGKKIALTEKIVKILKTLKCPHLIEPHQIQGLDFIHIYPLVQWLIKYSSEFRVAKEDELRKFAVQQYDKDYIFVSDRERFKKKFRMMQNIALVHNTYKPMRVRKCNIGATDNELELVTAVLSEYDQRILMNVTTKKDEDHNDDELQTMFDYEKALVDPSQITTDTTKYLENYTENSTNVDIHYAILKSELTGVMSEELELCEKQKCSSEIDRLSKTVDVMESEMQEFTDKHDKRMDDAKDQYVNVVSSLKKITSKFMQINDFSNNDVKNLFKSLKVLAKERNDLLQIIKHRENIARSLESELSSLKNPKSEIDTDPLTPEEMAEFKSRETKMKSYLVDLKQQLGKLNSELLRYTMAIDEVSGPAELLQYEKRFIELYNQVASKHKETKQFYIFYNTLHEVKLYTSKELNLLNSILDNYDDFFNESVLYTTLLPYIDNFRAEPGATESVNKPNWGWAMSSPKKREEFMSQFESIVEWVNNAVKKVEKKYNDEKQIKSQMHIEYSRLIDVQRQYAAALKRLAEERRKIHMV